MSLRLILVGKQGAGKGTQAKRLADHYGVPHISTGDAFRAEIASGTVLGYEIKSITDAGNLVSDEKTNEVVQARLSASDAANGFLLDGYPRNLAQASGLTQMLRPNEVDLVVVLDIDNEVAIERLSSRRVCKKCGAIYGADHMPKNPLLCDIDNGEVIQRDDDRPQSIAKRLALYEDQTAPILDYYGAMNKVVTIDGSGAADDVFGQLVQVIDTRSVDAPTLDH